LIASFTFPRTIFSSGQTNNIHLHQETELTILKAGADNGTWIGLKKAPYEAKENTFLLQETILKITFPKSNICI
jgi:hypothetical protein